MSFQTLESPFQFSRLSSEEILDHINVVVSVQVACPGEFSSWACIDHSATYFTPTILLSLLQTKMAALHRFIAYDINDLLGKFQTMNRLLNYSHIR